MTRRPHACSCLPFFVPSFGLRPVSEIGTARPEIALTGDFLGAFVNATDIIFNNPEVDHEDQPFSLDLLESGIRVADALELQEDARDLMFMLRSGWNGRN